MTKVVSEKMTAEEFEQHYLGKPFELIHGEVRSKMPAGFEHGAVALNLGGELRSYVKRHRLGVVNGAETGFVLMTPLGESVRAPDVAFTRQERLPSERIRGFSRIVPDLVAEVVSPSDTPASVQEKVQEWLEAGVQVVWVADPQTRTLTVYRADGTTERLTEQDTLKGDPVLPGFELQVSEIFE